MQSGQWINPVFTTNVPVLSSCHHPDNFFLFAPFRLTVLVWNAICAGGAWEGNGADAVVLLLWVAEGSREVSWGKTDAGLRSSSCCWCGCGCGWLNSIIFSSQFVKGKKWKEGWSEDPPKMTRTEEPVVEPKKKNGAIEKWRETNVHEAINAIYNRYLPITRKSFLHYE